MSDKLDQYYISVKLQINEAYLALQNLKEIKERLTGFKEMMKIYYKLMEIILLVKRKWLRIKKIILLVKRKWLRIKKLRY